jgi:hypothetical protein
MATKLYARSGGGTYGFNTNLADASGTTRGWATKALSATAGSSVLALQRATEAGPTNGLEIWTASPIPIHWLSEPLAADVTISGTITFNVWGLESAMAANVQPQVIVDQVGPTGTITEILNSESATEFGTAAEVRNWTGAPTSTAMKRGDRIRVRILGNDAGTMASGNTFNIDYDGPDAVDGDTWVQFTETLTFESDAAGTQLFLTDTASDVATADVDREAWTSRGSGSLTDVTNTAAGWTSAIQVTDTAGGTAVTWWTKRLSAFTLGGKATANLRAVESNQAANVGLRAEIAICDADGSNAVVWASAGQGGEVTDISDAAYPVYPAGPDTAVTDGQRLRIRVLVDDSAQSALVTGHTVTTTYNGTSAAAAGDTYVTLQQTVTEFTAPQPGFRLNL